MEVNLITINEREAKLRKRLLYEKEGKYELVSGFITQRKPALFRHVSCGYEWETQPITLLRAEAGKGCPNCQRMAKALSPEVYKQRVEESFLGEYIVINWEDYVNNSTPLNYLHTVCGTEFTLRPYSIFVNSMSCPTCLKRIPSSRKKTTETFEKELAMKYSGEYVLSEGSQYQSALDKINITHTACGFSWDVRASHILHSSGCPRCNISKGEALIQNVLEQGNVNYEREFTIKGCRNVKELPFDFSILKDGVVVGLIEYDGEQHFKAIKHFGGERKLRRTQMNDKIKDEYCQKAGIPLLRVKYTDSPAQIEHLVKGFIEECIGLVM